jgi:hypothetical protein
VLRRRFNPHQELAHFLAPMSPDDDILAATGSEALRGIDREDPDVPHRSVSNQVSCLSSHRQRLTIRSNAPRHSRRESMGGSLEGHLP